MSVDWTAIGAIGELIGAVAVVISIIYLAVQVRQNTRQIDQQTRTLTGGALTAAETLASNFRNSLARSPQVAALWRRATDDFDRLNPDEQTQAHWLFSDLFWIFQGLMLRKSQGALDDASWSLVELNIAYYMRLPGMRQWWPHGRRNYSRDFCAVVHRIVEEERSKLPRDSEQVRL